MRKRYSTRLGRAIAPGTAEHPELSGIYPLSDSLDAFAARYLLCEMAEKSLDIQYYIWQDDLSGRLLFSALLAAAGRGVRVRLLLDDNNTNGLDDILRLLNRHPLIEIRLFNPFSFRLFRALGYLSDFARLNRRMHNKGFTVDGEVAIVGGRNVGDAYFGVGEQPLFFDLDVLAIGPVVADVCGDFERYWCCSSVSTLNYVLENEESDDLAGLNITLPSDWQNADMARRYLRRLATSSFALRLEAGTLDMYWAKTSLLSDPPAKGAGRAHHHMLLTQRLISVIGQPENEIDIISAYFVPTRAGVAWILGMVRKGIKISVLTNSLAANDVAVVHAGYARWRKKLLRHGVELYEIKPQRNHTGMVHDRGLTGNSGSSLHAKTFSVDKQQIFIGSFNFDPRSSMLNTEMGFVIKSTSLANDIHQHFIKAHREAAWRLRLDDRGRINWLDEGEGTVLKKEPYARFWQRLLVHLAWLLPIEWLL